MREDGVAMNFSRGFSVSELDPGFCFFSGGLLLEGGEALLFFLNASGLAIPKVCPLEVSSIAGFIETSC